MNKTRSQSKACATCSKSLLGSNFQLIRPKFSRSKDPDYSKIIKECLNIQLQINKKMDSICSTCIKKLHCIAAFRNQVIQAQNILRTCEDGGRDQEMTVVKQELQYEELFDENDIDGDTWQSFENLAEYLQVVHDGGAEELEEDTVEMRTEQETKTIENDEAKYIQSLIKESDTLIKKARDDSVHYLTSIPKLEQMAEDDIYIIEKANSNDDAYSTDISAEYLEDEGCPEKETRKSTQLESKPKDKPQKRCALIRNIKKVNWRNKQKPSLKELCPEGVRTCETCDIEYPNTYLLKRHMSSVHYSQFICAVCGLGCFNAGSLKSHMYTHSDATYSCKYCDRVFKNKHSHSSHVRFAHTHVGMYYRCRVCAERFATDRQRLTHMRVKHQFDDKRHKCEACDKPFYTSSQCKAHYRKVHLKLRNHACERCPKLFRMRGELVWHMADAHGVGENPKCPVCKKKGFGYKSSLNLHIQQKHPDYNRITCELCGILCNTQRALENHLNSSIHRTHFRLQKEKKVGRAKDAEDSNQEVET